MADQTTTAAPAVQAALACRLRHARPQRGSSPTAGEVELENASSRMIEIEAEMHSLQHLNLVVTDSRGVVVSKGHYAEIFSPLGRIYTLRLAPGEKYTHNVSLLGNVPEEKRQPGQYAVRAVYEYRGIRAMSEPLQVQLPTKGG